MSSHIVEVCKIEEIAPHPNADKIEKIRIKNWWCVSQKSQYCVGDKVVYFPPDSVIPKELAKSWNIEKYCSPVSGDTDRVRIKANRFRGEPSFGFVKSIDDESWDVGHDVKEYYKCTKWEPPLKSMDGDAAHSINCFHTYTSIENICNFPYVFQEGEEVVVTEKIHGTNSRVGLVLNESDWEFVAGSHGLRRKEKDEKGNISRYWFPFYIGSNDPMKNMLSKIKESQNCLSSVVVFGEIFGRSVQDMTYGSKELSYRVFDIAVDNKYLDWDLVVEYCSDFKDSGINLVPILYRGPFCMKKMNELVDGPTTVCDTNLISEPFKGREGIVIKTSKERFDRSLPCNGRAILKYISVDYHERKNLNKSEDH